MRSCASAQLREALVPASRRRGDAERVDAGVTVGGDPLGDQRARPAQRDGVDQLAGERRRGVAPAAAQVEVGDLRARPRAKPWRATEPVVVVALARAHAADVERERRAHRVACAASRSSSTQRADAARDEEAVRASGRRARRPRPATRASAARCAGTRASG